jgi:hypothetical protein
MLTIWRSWPPQQHGCRLGVLARYCERSDIVVNITKAKVLLLAGTHSSGRSDEGQSGGPYICGGAARGGEQLLLPRHHVCSGAAADNSRGTSTDTGRARSHGSVQPAVRGPGGGGSRRAPPPVQHYGGLNALPQRRGAGSATYRHRGGREHPGRHVWQRQCGRDPCTWDISAPS